jgi:hypothetical protein
VCRLTPAILPRRSPLVRLLVVVAVQPRNKGATDATAKETGDHMVEAMRAAGFSTVKLLLKPMTPVATACVVASLLTFDFQLLTFNF